jgi:hypothetical protein
VKVFTPRDGGIRGKDGVNLRLASAVRELPASPSWVQNFLPGMQPVLPAAFPSASPQLAVRRQRVHPFHVMALRLTCRRLDSTCRLA